MVIRTHLPRRRTLRAGRRALAAGVGIAALVAVAGSTGASATSSGQHIWESGKVVRLADGDTVYVDVHGHTYSVRNLGIQATETSHGGVGKNECGAQAAKKYLTKLTLHKEVQLASMHESSESLGRLLRTVYVGKNKDLSRDLDVQAAEMSRGYTLWHPDPTDSAHNLYYHQLQVLAQHKQQHLWDPTFCGVGNDQGIQLKVWINSDANLSDAQHPNGEWVAVENMSKTRTANLSHWHVRDGSHVGDPAYTFPAHTKLKPGQVLKLHSGKGRSSVKTRNFYNWGDSKARWDDGDTNGMGEGAYLQDRLGNIRASDTYPCVVTAVSSCKDPLTQDLAWGQVEYAPGGEKQNPNLEYVTIRNTSTHTVNLSYRVVSHGGWVRTLMRGTILKPGAQLKVYAGKGHNTPLAQHFDSPNALFANAGGEVLMRTPNYVQTMCVDWGNVHAAHCSRASANQ
jgi:endonuclease YncB( thermonuclease family)